MLQVTALLKHTKRTRHRNTSSEAPNIDSKDQPRTAVVCKAGMDCPVEIFSWHCTHFVIKLILQYEAMC
jgi:hypothetical protein